MLKKFTQLQRHRRLKIKLLILDIVYRVVSLLEEEQRLNMIRKRDIYDDDVDLGRRFSES